MKVYFIGCFEKHDIFTSISKEITFIKYPEHTIDILHGHCEHIF